MRSSSGQYTSGTPPNEESGPLAEDTSLTCYCWSAPSVKGIDAVSCKSTSASLFIIHEWCPRPSLAVMPTGLQVRFPPLAPLPALLGLQFWVVPLQQGSTDPHGVPQFSVRP